MRQKNHVRKGGLPPLSGVGYAGNEGRGQATLPDL